MNVVAAVQSFPFLQKHPSFSPKIPPSFFALKTHLKISHSLKSHQALTPDPHTKTPQQSIRHNPNNYNEEEDDDGIPIEYVKTLVKFKSRYNYIRVLEVSRKADHSLAGCRLLLLDAPGNIHSISHIFKSITNAYFDVFATTPPIIPPGGPVGILGFGAGSAARILLELYPKVVVHGWEIDPDVISVGREYFGLQKLEKEYKYRIFIYIGNALNAGVRGGFSAILVDLYKKGCVIPELQDPDTWEKLKGCLKEGGRIMVNVGGSCVEAEDIRRDGKLIMEDTLEAIHQVFPGEVNVLTLENRKEDSSVALTGVLPDLDQWRKSLPKPLRYYVDGWKLYGQK